MEAATVSEPSYSLYGSEAYGAQTTANQTVKVNETKIELDTGKRGDFVEVVRAEMANNILRLKSSKNLEVTIGQLKEEEINSETII